MAMQTKKSAKLVAAMVVALFVFSNVMSALAATGGRMGGQAFSRPSRSVSSGRSSSSSRSRTCHHCSHSTTYVYPPSPPTANVENSSKPADPVKAEPMSVMDGFLLVSLIVVVVAFFVAAYRYFNQITVIKLQVGLVGKDRALQNDLDRIADTTNTSTTKGFHYILTETVLALLRNTDRCYSVHTRTNINYLVDSVKDRFNALSINERAKFDEETLVNVNSKKEYRAPNLRFKGRDEGYAVITILVAANGDHRLPVIKAEEDLKAALKKLGSMAVDDIMAVEVLWTPQCNNDVLSREELIKDYPLLQPLLSYKKCY